MNNMICDLETGVCRIAEEDEIEIMNFDNRNEIISVYYATDPICSHCWAFEPVLRRFKIQYGHYFNFHIVMGGLLESWNGFADVSNDISDPSDVASHWQEVGRHSRMPIDGSLWLKNPIQSSYPSSRVFKIIQKGNEHLAKIFLRRAREAVFAFNLNIGEEKILIQIVNQLGLNGEEIVKESNLLEGQQLLNQDFILAQTLGVRGFPTIIMVNKENKGIKIVGARSLEDYVNGLKQVLIIDKELKPKQQPTLIHLLQQEGRLFSREIEVMYDLKQNEVIPFIQKELSPDHYNFKEILGETYIESIRPL